MKLGILVGILGILVGILGTKWLNDIYGPNLERESLAMDRMSARCQAKVFHKASEHQQQHKKERVRSKLYVQEDVELK